MFLFVAAFEWNGCSTTRIFPFQYKTQEIASSDEIIVLDVVSKLISVESKQHLDALSADTLHLVAAVGWMLQKKGMWGSLIE